MQGKYLPKPKNIKPFKYKLYTDLSDSSNQIRSLALQIAEARQEDFDKITNLLVAEIKRHNKIRDIIYRYEHTS